jgi:hypothetical protein
MTARVTRNELAEHYKRLRLPGHGVDTRVHDIPSPPTLRSDERSLLAAWRKYLEYEESNPLAIDDDKAALTYRLINVYRKAVIQMRFYPEIWCVGLLRDLPCPSLIVAITGTSRISGHTKPNRMSTARDLSGKLVWNPPRF